MSEESEMRVEGGGEDRGWGRGVILFALFIDWAALGWTMSQFLPLPWLILAIVLNGLATAITAVMVTRPRGRR